MLVLKARLKLHRPHTTTQPESEVRRQVLVRGVEESSTYIM